VSDRLNNTSSATGLSLFANNNTTSTNYNHQRIQGNGTSANAARGVHPFIEFASENSRTLSYVHIKLSNIGAHTAQSYSSRDNETSSISIANYFISSNFENVTSITQLNLVSSSSNGIGTNSRFELYKLY